MSSGEDSRDARDDARPDRPDTAAAPASGQGAPAAGEGSIPLPGGGVLRDEDEREAPLPVGFTELIHPFLLVGLAGLGVLPQPDTNEPEVNLRAARAAIESLELLRAKTEGNRTPEETRLLDQALYELKMQYIEARERPRRG